MISSIEAQLAQMMTPESAQQVMTELEKHFDPDSKLAILSFNKKMKENLWTKEVELDFVEFVIRHTIPGEESPGYRVYYEHLYSLVYKDNSWEMTLLKLESVTI
jgi:hypothetical protein